MVVILTPIVLMVVGIPGYIYIYIHMYTVEVQGQTKKVFWNDPCKGFPILPRGRQRLVNLDFLGIYICKYIICIYIYIIICKHILTMYLKTQCRGHSQVPSTE